MKYDALINYTISPKGPVLISASTGNKLHPELPDRTFLTSRENGVETYVIPGSSLKGVIRNYLEKHFNQESTNALLGPLFHGGVKSKVSFFDLFADMNTVETTIRFSTMIGSVSQSASSGTLNQCEAVIKGNFNGSIRFRSVSEDEIVMVLTALTAMNNGEVCVGGKISRGFGRIFVSQFDMTITSGFNNDFSPNVVGKYTSIEEALSGVVKQ